MVKAFIVTFRIYPIPSHLQFGTGTSCSQNYFQITSPKKDVMVVANTIVDVAKKYPEASQIDEWNGDVDVLTNVICPVKNNE